MGLDPMLWGPKGWFFLHSITFNYPKNPSASDKTNYKMFFEQLSNVLPCEFCSEHFKKNLEKYPLNEEVLQNNKNLIQWLINIHNEVNVLNNKRKYTYDEVYNMYENIYKKNNNNLLFIIAMIIVIIILVTIIMKYLKK